MVHATSVIFKTLDPPTIYLSEERKCYSCAILSISIQGVMSGEESALSATNNGGSGQQQEATVEPLSVIEPSHKVCYM